MSSFNLVLCLFILGACCSLNVNSERSFTIDYENDQFLLDGKPFRYISGSLHYFRVPRIYWLDRLQKMYAAGLNAVQTYIDWSQHEPFPGTYNFNDNLDLGAFIKLAQKVGLLVIIRTGPFIDAEREMGGLPFWLLQKNPNIKLRTNDPTYVKYVDAWYQKIIPTLIPYFYSNGGPIIGLHVENEYGSFPACDFDYTTHLRELFRSIVGNAVQLFTTDGGSDSNLKCGKIEDVYATIDFGPGTNVDKAFQTQRNHQPRGPLVNSEYYPGWLDHWSYPHANPSTLVITETLNEILLRNASVNMYMFHGGTNFGFTAGSNLDITFYSVPTSYDYNAPISEAGDLTPKYYAIRNVIAKYKTLPPGPLPKPVPKFAYGTVKMAPVASLFEALLVMPTQQPIYSKYPLTFEMIGQAYGFVLYETFVSGQFMDPVILNIDGVRDRAIVFVEEVPVGILSRQDKISSLPIRIQNGEKLSLLVENVGRICFGPEIADFKGLTTNVTIGGKIQTDWKITSFPLNDTDQLNSLLKKFFYNKHHHHKTSTLANGQAYAPGFFAGTFVAPNNVSFPLDTFLNMTGWHKGVAFVNGFNIGRYWPIVGPQITLYIPKNFLKPYPSKNMLILFELEHAPCYNDINDVTCKVELVDTPKINASTPYILGRSYQIDYSRRRFH